MSDSVFGLPQEEIDRLLKEDEEEDRRLFEAVFPFSFVTLMREYESDEEESHVQ